MRLWVLFVVLSSSCIARHHTERVDERFERERVAPGVTQVTRYDHTRSDEVRGAFEGEAVLLSLGVATLVGLFTVLATNDDLLDFGR